jgi:hypothetical protein
VSALERQLNKLFTLCDGMLDQAVADVLMVFLYGEAVVSAMGD